MEGRKTFEAAGPTVRHLGNIVRDLLTARLLLVLLMLLCLPLLVPARGDFSVVGVGPHETAVICPLTSGFKQNFDIYFEPFNGSSRRVPVFHCLRLEKDPNNPSCIPSSNFSLVSLQARSVVIKAPTACVDDNGSFVSQRLPPDDHHPFSNCSVLHHVSSDDTPEPLTTAALSNPATDLPGDDLTKQSSTVGDQSSTGDRSATASPGTPVVGLPHTKTASTCDNGSTVSSLITAVVGLSVCLLLAVLFIVGLFVALVLQWRDMGRLHAEVVELRKRNPGEGQALIG